MNDLRFAIRQLGKSPGFTVVAVLTLALGIGANTTMFTAINAILLRPLPYPQPDRLVQIMEAARQESPSVVAYPDFLDWQQQTKLFAEMAAYQLAAFNLTGADESERVPGLRITANFFRTLGVKPALGRDFLAEEDEPGGSAVLLLTHRLWVRRFGADPAVIGRTVPLNGRGHVVVGVLPPGVVAYEEAQAFVPLGSMKPGLMSRGTRNALFVKGRLKPGVTRAQAQAELDVIAQRLEQQYPETNTSRRAVITSPRHPEMEQEIQTILFTLMARDPGFDPEHVLTVKLHRGGAGTADAEREAAFWRELFTRLQNLPGVVSVAAAFPMPLERSSWTCPFFVEGQPLPARGQAAITDVFSVSSDYFRTLGAGLLHGRCFSPEEGAQSAKVALINRTLAERHSPDESPVGKRFRVFPLESPDPWRTVVGVVEDFRLHALDERPKPAVYLPSASGAGLILRTESDPLSLLAAVREQVRDLDPNQPLYDCKSLEQCMAESAVGRRATCWLLGIFAGIALALAAVGIYGLISYSVAQRTHEIGVRMALGAERSQVTRQVVGGSMKLALVGVAVGLGAAGGLTGLLTNLLYDIRPLDPTTFTAAFGVLLGVALLASYLPARRAARVDPVVALRCE